MLKYIIFLHWIIHGVKTDEDKKDLQAAENYRTALKQKTADLTNKIPCLDRSAKYRARPDKVIRKKNDK